MEYTPIEIEKYLELPYIKELSDEIKTEIRKVRTTWDYMSWPMYQMLVEQGALKRFRKLKKPRSLYVSEEGFIYYFCTYNKAFNYAAAFKNEE